METNRLITKFTIPAIKSPSRPIAMALALLLVAMVATACGNESEEVTIRMALLPITDALPIHVADEEGFFAEENVRVEFVPVTSAPQRDQIIQAGQADGMINEVLSTMFYNVDGPEVVIVRFARRATPDFPHFYILGSPAAGAQSLADLEGGQIGISEGTVIEYSTDRLLEAEGFTPDEFEMVAVPSIPDRLALLNSGELAAANMPDPLAALAVQNGAVVLADDASHPQYGHSVISFRKAYVDENPEAVRRFLVALERAVEQLNADKEQFNDLLAERELVPAPLLGSYTIPDFPTASVPDADIWQDVLSWANDKGYLAGELPYEVSVDDAFLP